MELQDARKLGQEAQEALRKRAVRLVTVERYTQEAAASAVGVARGTVAKWVSVYRASGESGLNRRKRGRDSASQRALTGAEERRIQGWIRDRCPDQMKLPFALWTAGAVRELIARGLGKKLGLSTVQLYLKRWGFTPQKPLKRATQRSQKAINDWLETEYPAIAARAKREGAVIYWGDETGVSNQDQVGRGYAPKGQTPILTQTAKKFGTSMISAVTNRGHCRFMLYEGALNVALFLAFLKRLIRDNPHKVFLVVDNLKVHHALKVTAWAEKNKSRIELFYLPPYAPEHNPDEYLNNDLKQQIKNKPKPESRPVLVKATASVMRSIQKQPHRVQSYFHARQVRYAA